MGYASPTSFYHDSAENEESPIIKLERKILIFLDMPHYELLAKLRPILSHDQKEIIVKITDRGKRKMRTKTITIIGFPAVIFCSANPEINEQESTRFLVLSPETSQEKLRQSVTERIKKESDNISYTGKLKSDKSRKELIERISYIKESNIKEILMGKDLSDKIQNIFLSKTTLKPRHSRDSSRLINLVKSFALLNLWDKKTADDEVIEATMSDLNEVLPIWQEISESQELNLPPYILEIYKKTILPLFETGILSVTRQEVLKKYYMAFGRPLSEAHLRKQIIPMLEVAGLIMQEEDPRDRRNKTIKLIT
jgi:hypothetical protein